MTLYRITEETQCGVVVLGAGGSGLVAAARAAQLSGARVIVLEKTAHIGGGAVYANFTRTFDSQWQRRHGLECRTADYIRFMQDVMRWRVDMALAVDSVRATGAFFDWMLEQEPGLDDLFSEGRYVFPTPFDPVGPQTTIESERNFGRIVVDSMLTLCRKYGVEIRNGTRAAEIETENGCVTGVVALSERGYIRIRCRTCILATGSWIGNDAIVSQVCPSFDRRVQAKTPHMDPALTGDGIALAERAGAYIDRDSFCLRFVRTTGARAHPVVRALMRSPAPISVNMDGRRYCSEPVGRMERFSGGFVQMAQPYGICFFVLDQNSLEAVLQLPLEKADALEESYGEYELSSDVRELRRQLDAAAAEEPQTVFSAPSLEKLADRMGVDKMAFLETVRRYNESCRAGADWDFVKKPESLIPLDKGPYYAIRAAVDALGASGGVLVDRFMRAVNSGRDGVVDGLYAVGDMASGGFVNDGGLAIQLLNELAWAAAGGYIAGTEAARRAGAEYNGKTEKKEHR